MVNVQGEWAEFSFFRPQAESVFLAGDFNNWRQNELKMTANGNGYWTARLRLTSGEFKFRYCADGAWYTDYAAFGVEPGRFGLDSVLRVADRPLKVAPAVVAPAATAPATAVAAA